MDYFMLFVIERGALLGLGCLSLMVGVFCSSWHKGTRALVVVFGGHLILSSIQMGDVITRCDSIGRSMNVGAAYNFEKKSCDYIDLSNRAAPVVRSVNLN